MPALPEMAVAAQRIFGVRGRLAYRPDGGAVQCHACGGAFVNLTQHARRAHGLTAADYRRRFRIPPDAPLAAPAFSARMRAAARRAASKRRGTRAYQTANARRSAALRALPRVTRPCGGCGVPVGAAWTRRSQGQVYCPPCGAARERERKRLDMARRRARQRFLAVQPELGVTARSRGAGGADPRRPRRLALERLARQLLADLVALDPAGALNYGHLGELAESPDGARVQCHLCGRYWVNLGSHVRATHGLSANDYREAYGLNRTQPLLSPRFRAQMAATSRALGLGKPNIADFAPVAPGMHMPAHRLQGRRQQSATAPKRHRPRTVACHGCGAPVGVLQYHPNQPVYCPDCRRARHLARLRAGNRRRRDRYRAAFPLQLVDGRPMIEIPCARCAGGVLVPFNLRTARVYCQACRGEVRRARQRRGRPGAKASTRGAAPRQSVVQLAPGGRPTAAARQRS
jgi:predicted transcriptional regulator